MKFTTPCYWDANDVLTVHTIGQFTHFDIKSDGGRVFSVVLSPEVLAQLDEAIDRHLNDWQKRKEAEAKTTPPTYSALSDQSKLVFRHMDRAGSISAREAMDDYGITSATLARRICDIEAEGFKVWRDRRVHPMTGKRYTRYSLMEANTQAIAA